MTALFFHPNKPSVFAYTWVVNKPDLILVLTIHQLDLLHYITTAYHGTRQFIILKAYFRQRQKRQLHFTPHIQHENRKYMFVLEPRSPHLIPEGLPCNKIPAN